VPPDDTKPGIALADRLREENERGRRKEDDLAKAADANLEDLEDFATRLLPREVRRLERAKWDPVRAETAVRAEPVHAHPPTKPCDEENLSLPVLRVVPVSYRKYAIGALLMAALLGIVGQDKVKALFAVLFSDSPAEAEEGRKKKPPEDSGSVEPE
jgi:hypothetical protein